jgi:hypothetical protein
MILNGNLLMTQRLGDLGGRQSVYDKQSSLGYQQFTSYFLTVVSNE